MRKPKISEQYDKESYIKGFKKGWGECLAVALHTLSKCAITSDEEFKDTVLKQHPYHSSEQKVIDK